MLIEIPEIYGAEQRLAHRAASPPVVEKLPGRIEWWRAYTARNGDELNNDPSHGNNTGGLTAMRENRSAPSPRAAPPRSTRSTNVPNLSRRPVSCSSTRLATIRCH